MQLERREILQKVNRDERRRTGPQPVVSSFLPNRLENINRSSGIFSMTNLINNTSTRLIRRKEVQSLIGLSRSSIYSKLDSNSPQFDASFPRPVNLGSRSIAWVESELQAWIASRVSDREAA